MQEEIKEMIQCLLKNKFGDMKDVYKQIDKITSAILYDYYGSIGRPISFPIDIQGMIHKENIEVIDSSSNNSFLIPRIYRQDSCLKEVKELSGNKGWNMLINYEDSPNQKRYIMTYTYCNYILKKYGDVLCGTEFYVEEKIFKRWSEYVAEIMTAFLITPWELFLDLMVCYVDYLKNQHCMKIDTYPFLRLISENAQIPFNNMSNIFQHIKCYSSILLDEGNSILKKYEELIK